MVDYVPDRGDIVCLEFAPQKGKEIQKTRPALIISPKSYNLKTKLVLCMPITSKIKGYPFEVIINEGPIKGAILSDQIRSLDWLARKATFIFRCDPGLIVEALIRLKLLID